MSGFSGPMPGPGFKQQMAKWNEPSLEFQHSGQLTSHKDFILGSPRRAGRIIDAYFSVGNCGIDNTGAELSLALDVKINDTSIFTTKPEIAYVTGEAVGERKSTVDTTDTGVTVGVINSAANEYDPGDIITGNLAMTRTASPASEIKEVAVVAILNPK
jgi:hypothetical protein